MELLRKMKNKFKGLDIYIIYALIVFEADVNVVDANGYSPRHWLCQNEANKYQHSSARDAALYALDAVHAQRCQFGVPHCSAGCICVESVTRQQQSLGISQTSSFGYIFQIFQDMSSKATGGFNSSSILRTSPGKERDLGTDPDVMVPKTTNAASVLSLDADWNNAELFNGTPPDPVLNKKSLKDDLDNDLFSCFSTDFNGNKWDRAKRTVGRVLPTFINHAARMPTANSSFERRRSSTPTHLPAVPDEALAAADGNEYEQLSIPAASMRAGPPQHTSCLDLAAQASDSDEYSIPPHSKSMSSMDNFPGTTSFSLPANPSVDKKPCALSPEQPATTSLSAKDVSPKRRSSWFENSMFSSILAVMMPGLEEIFSSSPEVLHNDMETSPPLLSEKFSQEAGADFCCVVPSAIDNSLATPCDPFNPTNALYKYTWSRHFPDCSAPPLVPCCAQRNSRCVALKRIQDVPADRSKPDIDDNAIEANSSHNDFLHYDSEGFPCSKRGYRVLCLDGGGIRGLVLCQALRAVERAAGRPIRELYDWIIGTSTGAMLALNIAQGKCVRYNRALYFNMKDKIFAGKRPYPTEELETMLMEEFGSRSFMSEITDLRVSVTSLRGDHFPPKLYMFRNYDAPYERMEQLVTELIAERSSGMTSPSTSPRRVVVTRQLVEAPSSPSNGMPVADESSMRQHVMARTVPMTQLLGTVVNKLFGETIKEVGDPEKGTNLEEDIVALLSSFSRRYVYDSMVYTRVPKEEQLIWQAARASGAAPSYFRPCGPYLDGGLISNNPTLDILTEIQEMNLVKRLRRESIVPICNITSLGTGRIPIREVHQIDVFRPQNMVEAYRAAVGVSELSRILVEMATMSEGRVVERSRAWCSSLGVPFFRLSPMLSTDVSLDATDTKLILRMLWETEAYLCNCQERIHRLTNQLLSDHD